MIVFISNNAVGGGKVMVVRGGVGWVNDTLKVFI